MSYITDKIKNNIKKYGILKTLKRMYIKVSHIIKGKFFNLINKEKYNKKLDEILSDKNIKNVILQFPFFDYNMPNFQRFQQIARTLGSYNENIFFYSTPNNIYDNVYGFKNIENNLYLTNQYDLILSKDIASVNEKLEQQYKKKTFVIFVSTDTKWKILDVEKVLEKNYEVIYDYVDEIDKNIIGDYSEELIKKHKYMLKNEKIRVIVTAEKLLQDVEKYRNKNYTLISNGVNLDDFIINKNEAMLEKDKFYKLVEFKKNYKMILLYYGALANWFDYELVKYICKDKDIGYVLIGIDYDKSLEKSRIEEIENVIYIGSINYKELKYFANEADILTIPFKVNNITNATSPVKLFEYMAMKKKIITTDMTECKKYSSVDVVSSYDGFVQAINLYKKNRSFDQINMYKEAEKNSWKNKMKDYIEE